MRFSLFLPILFLFIVLLISCRKDPVEDASVQSSMTFEEKRGILMNMGFPQEIIREMDGLIVVDDIVFSDEFFQASKQKSTISQFMTPISNVNQATIQVYIQTPMVSDWTNALTDALWEMNHLPNCNLKFTSVGSTSNQLNIPNAIRFYTYSGTLGPAIDTPYGGADWPVNGSV